ncbi:MAG TPA: COX15/CtaA family protein [Bryobacteraceae bacterium]|nr:COX15/CtaA family protein [Bryobacteraceae bacterium]
MANLEIAAAPAPAAVRTGRFARYCWGLVAYNLVVILWGAVVRATGSGAGCGDHWPLCNGNASPNLGSVHTAIEFTHRMMSGLDVALVALLVVWAFRALPKGHAARLGAALAGVFLVTEALLGAGLVLLKKVAQNADAWWNSAHLLNTLCLVAWLALTAWWASGHEAKRPRGRPGWMGWIALASFALLGVSGVIAALGDTLFPAKSVAEGFAQDFNPAASVFLRLRIWHPAIAGAVGVWLLFYGLDAASAEGERRRLGYAMLAILALQMAVGGLNLLLLAPVWIQLAHLLLADLLWISMVLLVAEAGVPGDGRRNFGSSQQIF